MEENSPNLEGTFRHQDRRYRCEDSEHSRRRSFSKEESDVPDIVSTPPDNADDLDAKTLRKLRKEQRRRAKKEKKL